MNVQITRLAYRISRSRPDERGVGKTKGYFLLLFVEGSIVLQEFGFKFLPFVFGKLLEVLVENLCSYVFLHTSCCLFGLYCFLVLFRQLR